MESNKEFIARMMVFINELPEDKRRDYNTLLSFLDVQNMVGLKLGEFSPTRTYYGHTADKKAKK